MKKTIISVSAVASAVAPMIAGAQTSTAFGGVFSILDLASSLVNRLIPFIIAITVLVFLWGILKYVISTDGESRDEARGYMIWGIIALFVMVSVWGLVNILVKSVGLDNNAPQAPQLPNPGGTYTYR